MELFWAVLGLYWARVDSLGGNLAPSWAVLGPSRAVMRLYWAVLEPSWLSGRSLGAVVGPFWAVEGPSEAVLDPGPLGPAWGSLGTVLGRLEAFSALLRPY